MNQRLKNIHPGEILREEFLAPLKITAYRLAKETCIPQTAISEILREKRSITVPVALKFSKFFGTSAQFWIGLQYGYDLEEQQNHLKKQLKKIHSIKELGLATR